MHNLQRFLYLNIYSILLLLLGGGISIFPLYRISLLLIIPQVVFAILLFKKSYQLFSSWQDKKRKYLILMAKNNNEWNKVTFQVFMQAPCGRLLVRAVLHDLHCPERYQELLPYKKSVIELLKDSIKPIKTKIYINPEAFDNT